MKISSQAICKNKPNPVGFKNIVVATLQVLMLHFFVYQGHLANRKPGIGGSVKKIREDVNRDSICIMDRYFTFWLFTRKLYSCSWYREQEKKVTLSNKDLMNEEAAIKC